MRRKRKLFAANYAVIKASILRTASAADLR